MARTGRPKSENPKDRIVTVRFTGEEYEMLKRLASYRESTVTNVIKDGISALQNDFSESSLLKEGTEKDDEKGQQG